MYLPENISHQFLFDKFEIFSLPIFMDNLAYIIKNNETKEFILVDPADFSFI